MKHLDGRVWEWIMNECIVNMLSELVRMCEKVIPRMLLELQYVHTRASHMYTFKDKILKFTI